MITVIIMIYDCYNNRDIRIVMITVTIKIDSFETRRSFGMLAVVT